MLSSLGFSALNFLSQTKIGQNLILNASTGKDSFLSGIGGKSGGGSAEAVQNSMTTLVNTLIIFGGIWVVACIVFSGVKLSGAQGKNPENRSQAIIGLACAALGGFIMIKAYDIASWVATL